MILISSSLSSISVVKISVGIVSVITDISSKFEIDLGVLQKSISTVSTDILKNVGSYISNGAMNVLNASINVVTNLIIVAAVSIYLLWDMDNIRGFFRRILIRRNKRSYRYVKKLDTEINNYFSGLFRTMLIQFIEYFLDVNLV